MQFQEGYIYHIYNQGNSRQKIFFSRENYLYFLRKIRTYIFVNTVSVALSDADGKNRSLNDSIGIMLRSYTNAINKQENRTGKLFREATKSECVNCPNGIIPSFIGNKINIPNPEKQYPQVCFNYIHQNPVKAKLVKKDINWEFSSAQDYKNIRNGKLINKKTAKDYGLI